MNAATFFEPLKKIAPFMYLTMHKMAGLSIGSRIVVRVRARPLARLPHKKLKQVSVVSIVSIVAIVLMEDEDVGTPQNYEEEHQACAQA